jgi:AcrR family transcriptional regulator
MAAIARAAGLAKGTVYLYFDTKESVFLDLVSSELAAWVADSSARLEETNQNATPADVAKAVASALAERPALIRLIALLHVVLEQNTEREALRAFKIRLLAITEQAAGVFEQALRLEPGTGTRLVLWMHALTVGLSQITPQGCAGRGARGAGPGVGCLPTGSANGARGGAHGVIHIADGSSQSFFARLLAPAAVQIASGI